MVSPAVKICSFFWCMFGGAFGFTWDYLVSGINMKHFFDNFKHTKKGIHTKNMLSVLP